ncbi:hypothetical protein ACFVTF_23360 [Kitasatospora sp. NPDC057940]|uniref:hypothetical protein n=1 Tax=Kitasatospora sp. NPDC057940 TaxID=3346285 RepID=UPI0036DC9096
MHTTRPRPTARQRTAVALTVLTAVLATTTAAAQPNTPHTKVLPTAQCGTPLPRFDPAHVTAPAGHTNPIVDAAGVQFFLLCGFQDTTVGKENRGFGLKHINYRHVDFNPPDVAAFMPGAAVNLTDLFLCLEHLATAVPAPSTATNDEYTAANTAATQNWRMIVNTITRNVVTVYKLGPTVADSHENQANCR